MDIKKTIEDLKAGIREYVVRSHHVNKAFLSTKTLKTETYFDYRIPLLCCVYFLIPAISIVIVRNWFEDYTRGKEIKTYSLQVRSVLGYLVATIGSFFYFASVFTYNELLLGKMYIVVACFMALFLILLSYGWRRKPDVRVGVMISYLGIAMSFISLAVLGFYKEEYELVLVIYDIGIVVFIAGIVVIHMIALSV